MSRNLPDGYKKEDGESIPDTGNCKYKCLKVVRKLQVHLHVGYLWEKHRSPGLRSGNSRGGTETGITPTRGGLKEWKHKLTGVTDF